MGISSTLVDLGMLPIQDISQLPKSAREVLTVAGLILEHLREAQASDTGSLDCAHGFGLSAPAFFHSFFPLPLGMTVIYIFTHTQTHTYIYL
jgi:hypothetical protein